MQPNRSIRQSIAERFINSLLIPFVILLMYSFLSLFISYSLCSVDYLSSLIGEYRNLCRNRLEVFHLLSLVYLQLKSRTFLSSMYPSKWSLICTGPQPDEQPV